MMLFQAGPVKIPGRPNPTGRLTRKIALVGSHTGSLKWCPWGDPSWEFWGHAASRQWCRHELDRYFDLHPRACWVKNGKESTKYRDWLKANLVPIYMQEKHPDVPASVRFPREQILMDYGGLRRYFKNQVAWMIALAFSEGVTTLGLFGINYGHETEYEIQRGSAEYWLGRAEERGVRVILPDECTLLAEPAGLYGYESHTKEGKRLPQYTERKPKLAETIHPVMPGQKVDRAVPPAWLLEDIAAEEATRPEWALGPMNGGQDGD